MKLTYTEWLNKFNAELRRLNREKLINCFPYEQLSTAWLFGHTPEATAQALNNQLVPTI